MFALPALLMVCGCLPPPSQNSGPGQDPSSSASTDRDRQASSAGQVQDPWKGSHIDTGTPVDQPQRSRQSVNGSGAGGSWDNDSSGNDQPNVDNAPGGSSGPAGGRVNGGLGGLGSVIGWGGAYGAAAGAGAASGGGAGAGGYAQPGGSRGGGGHRGTPGQFDFYLLTLSWAPEYCHGHGNSPECDGSHRGFVVHGLWPQDNDGGWPESCSAEAEPANAQAMLDIMPDPRLIEHEWAKHGTCSGLAGPQYFDTVRRAYREIHIPGQLQNPAQTARVSAAQIKQAFASANAGLPESAIAVSCQNRYLAGVEFCLGKDLKPVQCRAIRDCTQEQITIPASQ